MQYFIFLIWLFLTLFPICWFAYRARKFHHNFIKRQLNTMLIDLPLYSSILIKSITSHINKQPARIKKILLQNIASHQLNALQKNLKSTSLKKQLLLLTKDSYFIAKPQTPLEALLCANKLINNNNYYQASLLLDKINERPKSPELAALKLFTEAKILHHEGDLLNSSSWCTQALNLFHKQFLIYEEASSYLLLSQIYNDADLFDSSELTLRNALKLFQQINSQYYIAQCYCNLAILTAAQERWDEACNYFNKATADASKIKDKTLLHSISCHQALLDINLGNPHHAITKLKSFVASTDNNLNAFHHYVLAQAHLKLKHWQKASTLAEKSQKLYISTSNHAAAATVATTIEHISKHLKNYKIL